MALKNTSYLIHEFSNCPPLLFISLVSLNMYTVTEKPQIFQETTSDKHASTSRGSNNYGRKANSFGGTALSAHLERNSYKYL